MVVCGGVEWSRCNEGSLAGDDAVELVLEPLHRLLARNAVLRAHLRYTATVRFEISGGSGLTVFDYQNSTVC